MTALTPQAVHELFTEYFTAGNLEGLVTLYEADAVLIPEPGQQVRGGAAIREALAGFLALQGTFRMEPAKVVQADDIAILYAHWTLTATGPDGAPLQLAGQTADVVRRRTDGTWRMVIDNPYGATGVVD